MKLHYYPETDSLYIELRPGPGAETREVAPGVNADFDSAGAVVGLDIDQASGKLDLSTLETVALPFTTTHAA
ncbi:DUF2283 domain-containing protein [Devosia sp.]|uniref:DUF2283 domain-containing protein n=1 Tax=Devosia sp. TaxID=1871048 RepID=UPI002FC689F3